MKKPIEKSSVEDVKNDAPFDGASGETTLLSQKKKEEQEPAQPDVFGHVLVKGKAIPLHDGDIVVTCAEPGFRRAGLEHPHMRVHPEGSLTEEQLNLLRAEPKISVIEIGG